MSKKPLLSEGTARRWAKYAGIQNESKTLLSEMYKNEMVYNEEALEEEALEENLEEEALEEEALEEGEGLEEAAVLAELEEMLAEQDEEDEEDDLGMDPVDDEGEPPEDDEDMEDEEDELDVDAEEAEADEAAMMSQEDVEAALKAGLEAMASAVADALKISIDVRSGEDIEDEAGEEPEAEEEVMEMDYSVEEGHGKMPHPGGMEEANMYEGLDRDELVERVMKRVAARLVKESKEG